MTTMTAVTVRRWVGPGSAIADLLGLVAGHGLVHGCLAELEVL